MRPVLAFVALLLAAAGARAVEAKLPGPGWEEANRNDDLVIFTHDNPQVGTRDIIAVGEVDAAPQAVFDVVVDFDHYPQFMPYVKESRNLKKTSDLQVTVYALLSPPLVDDRDYAIEVTKTVGTGRNGGVFKSAWVAVPDAAPPRESVVRVKINTGSWVMEPLDGGKRTRLTYNLSTHPGGSIPTWIANKSNTVAIPDLFKAVRAQSTKGRK